MTELQKKFYKIYVEWRSKILTKNDPKTPEEFIEKYKMPEDLIPLFEAQPTFSEDLMEATLLWAKKKTPELIHLVYREVQLSKSVADLERFIAIVHDLKRKDKEDKAINNFNFFNGVTDKQYKSIVAREARIIDNPTTTLSDGSEK